MNEQIAGQENFSLPHDIVVLPSEGKYYKNKKKSVKVGYLTAVDENLIVSLSTGEATQMMSQLIRNKLYEPELFCWIANMFAVMLGVDVKVAAP